MAFFAPSYVEGTTTDYCHLGDLEPIAIRDVSRHAMTDVYATVQMPAQIGPNQHGNLRCKVDTGASGYVMPLHGLPNSSLGASVYGKPMGLFPQTPA